MPTVRTTRAAVVPTYDVSTVFVCADCMNVAANGPHPDDSELAYRPLSRVPDGYHVLLGTDMLDFTDRRCATCHSPYAGARYECTLMSIEPTVCQQCIDLIRHHH